VEAMSRWFRFYDDALNDPKVQRLSPDLFKAWVNLLCLASRSGGELKSIADVAFSLRLSEVKAAAVITSLVTKGLLDKKEDGYFAPHNWDRRQYKSDVSNERVQRHRERHRNGECNVTQTVTVTPPETEQIQNRTKPSLRDGARKRATRIPDDWKPSLEDIEFAKGLGLTDSDIVRQAARFLDFWKGKSGQGGTKVDWPATWRNWVRGEAEKLGRSPPETQQPCANNKFYAEFGTAQLDAWDAYNRRTKGASLPRDKRGGWLVDAEWPPGFSHEKDQDDQQSMH
jgi:hypothetical protein